jgi:hypothetical protein
MLGLKTKNKSNDFSSTSMAPGEGQVPQSKSSKAGRMVLGTLHALVLILVIVIVFMWFIGHNEKGGFERPDVVTRLIDNSPSY